MNLLMESGSDKRVLLTGGTGMIGANLARRLISDGYQVFLMTRPGSNLSRLDSIQGCVTTLEADITAAESVRAAVEAAKPKIVMHLASTAWSPPPAAPDVHFRVNLLGNLYLMEALQNFPQARLIFTSSCAIYGGGHQLREADNISPQTLFGASKACAGILLQTFSTLHRLNTVELRLFTPYGPWEDAHRLVPHVILSALAGNDVPLTRGDQERDFVYVGDVVDALMLAATRPLSSGAVFNIGSGVGTPAGEVAERIVGLMGNLIKLRFGELPTRSDEIMKMSADISAAREVLGWQPQTTLEQGLQNSIDWFTERKALALV